MTKTWHVIDPQHKPPGWGDQWEYPQRVAWPPGWPRKWVGHLSRISAEWTDDRVLVVRCFDTYDEPTDHLEDEIIRVMAGTDQHKIRVRPTGEQEDVWYEGILMPIRKQSDGWGNQIALSFDEKRINGCRVLIDVGLYGIKQGPFVSITV